MVCGSCQYNMITKKFFFILMYSLWLFHLNILVLNIKFTFYLLLIGKIKLLKVIFHFLSLTLLVFSIKLIDLIFCASQLFCLSPGSGKNFTVTFCGQLQVLNMSSIEKSHWQSWYHGPWKSAFFDFIATSYLQKPQIEKVLFVKELRMRKLSILYKTYMLVWGLSILKLNPIKT